MRFFTLTQKRRQRDYGTENAANFDMLPFVPLLVFMASMPLLTSQQMWICGVIITVSLTALVFVANHYWQGRRTRIERVANEYFKIYESRKPGVFVNGLHVLLKAGGMELRGRCELAAVFRRITARQLPHPNWAAKDLPDSKVLAFFRFCQKCNHDIADPTEAAFAISLFRKELI
jgi:hypothetical protein